MSKNILLVLAGVVIAGVVLLGRLFLSGSPTASQEVTGSIPVVGNANQQAAPPTELDETTSWYTAYSPGTLAAATVGNQKAVIFFHASWCPTCKAASEDFQANIDKIPGDVTILKADYDTETELKKKYGVVMQDTFVQVDSTGKELSKWNSGGEGVKTLLANLK